MSMFLPDATSQPSSPFSDSSAPNSAEVTQGDIALMQRILSAAAQNVNLIPADFMAYVLDWIQTQRLTIPIGQVFGFSQFTAQYDRVDTSESTTSTSYDDLATPGPKFSGLSAGQYVLLYGAVADVSSSSDTAFVAPAVAGVLPTNQVAAWTSSPTFASIASASLATLSTPSDIELKYAISPSGTATFLNRWLIALKFAN